MPPASGDDNKGKLDQKIFYLSAAARVRRAAGVRGTLGARARACEREPLWVLIH